MDRGYLVSKPLLRTLAGSRLYGTATPDSDWDYYEVYDRIRTSQRKRDDLDVIKMPLAKWLDLCAKGTHQALDALWCPPEYAEVDEIPWLRWSVRVDPWRVADQLERTARALERSRQSEKRDKHALRLRHCAARVREQGWYDPTEYGRRLNENG